MENNYHRLNTTLVPVSDPRVTHPRKKKKNLRNHHRSTKVANIREANAGASETAEYVMEEANKTYSGKKIRIKRIQKMQGARDSRQQHKSVIITITHTFI